MKEPWKKKKTLLPFLLLGVALSLPAQEKRPRNTYYSEELKAIAVYSNLITISDTLNDGVFYGIASYKNKPITIIVEDNEVKHIGFSLFSPEYRNFFNPLCCNFIERYALLLKIPVQRNKIYHDKMEQDRVIFRTGNFETIEDFAGGNFFQICHNYENNVHFFRWEKEGRVVCELGFPSSYKLLLGMEMDELDARLKRDILNTKTPLTDSVQVFSKGDLVASITGDYYVKKGSCYYFAELNSDKFFQLKNMQENRYTLMFNQKYPRQSLANVMTSSGLPNDFLLRVKQEVYGYKDSVYTVPLTKYIDFCLKNNCTPYFGIISETNDIIDCELIMRNEVLQYNHVMRMKVSVKDVENRKGLIDARLDAYVPTHYLKNLFNEFNELRQ